MDRLSRRDFLKTTGAAAAAAAAIGAAGPINPEAARAAEQAATALPGPGGVAAASAQPGLDRTVLPLADPAFTGSINRTLAGSAPDWGLATPPAPPPGAPNVILVLIDDAGFGNPSTFGGPINTPTYSRVAREGLTYNHFHVAALCSPTRAALLSSRNHHYVGFGSVAEFSGPFPGYSTNVPQACAPFPKVLQLNGYSTAMFGKAHITTQNQDGPAGPFTHWPNGWGFDYYYGFLTGDSGQYDPLPVVNNLVTGPPTTADYFLTDAMADQAIQWIHNVRAQDPDKPYFMFFSTGATHAPHQVPPAWSDKYKGKFDQGWDKLREESIARQKQLGVIPANTQLTTRPDAIPAWDSIPADQRAYYSRQMEVYAGFGENADWNVGRLLDAVEQMGDADNTLVLWIWGDNGCSLEGTPTGTFNEGATLNGVPLTAEEQVALVNGYGGLDKWGTDRFFPLYSAAWAWAGNCPFQWGKQVASHLGGARDPMVVRWPKRIRPDARPRTQFTHVIDVGPTIIEAAGLPQPRIVEGVQQDPMQGPSFLYSFDNPTAPEQHTQQYFEIVGNRGMYKDGWWWASMAPRIPWDLSPSAMAKIAPGVWNPDNDPSELYYLPDDFSQSTNLAGQRPDKVKELSDLWWQEAQKYRVLPLLTAFSGFFGMTPPPPSGPRTWTYYGSDVDNLLPGIIPPIYAHSYSISADLVIPPGGADGVIIAEADVMGGFALFVEGGKLKHTYSFQGIKLERQESSGPLPTGNVNVRMDFAIDEPKPASGGTVTLSVNGQSVGSGQIEHTNPVYCSSYAGMDIGKDKGLAVDPAYAAKLPFAFAGTIKKVAITVLPAPTAEMEKRANDLVSQEQVAWALSG